MLKNFVYICKSIHRKYKSSFVQKVKIIFTNEIRVHLMGYFGYFHMKPKNKSCLSPLSSDFNLLDKYLKSKSLVICT